MAGVYPVIMCGGVGSRLWPLSRKSRPKQFIDILGNKTLFQRAAERVRGLAGFKRLTVITGADQAHWVVRQLDQLGLEADVIMEPEGRDSAAAVAVACAHVALAEPDGVLVVVPSDHHIPDTDHYRADLEVAIQNAGAGNLVTIGIAPTEPSTAFGYILPRDLVAVVGPIRRFKEKPNAAVARDYIKQGYLWNSGSFIARADCLIGEFERHAPQVLNCAREGLASARNAENGLLLGSTFLSAQKVAFDVAVMEKTDIGTVLRSTMNWSDLGAWDAVYKAMAKDANDNARTGEALFHDSTGCAVRVNNGGLAVLSSVQNLNVVVEDDVVLVSSIKHAHTMKGVVDLLNTNKLPQIDTRRPEFSLARETQRLESWLHTAAYPLWATAGFDYRLGLWRESLDGQGRPTNQPIRGRVQGRQNFVFARAAAQGWSGPSALLLQRASEGEAARLDRPDNLRRGLISPEGECLDDEALLYDQTFRLLAIAAQLEMTQGQALAAVSGDRAGDAADRGGFAEVSARFLHAPPSADLTSIASLHAQANAMMDQLEIAFGEDGRSGCFTEGQEAVRLANPMMHLFEAAIAMRAAALETRVDDARWLKLANAIADLAVSNLIDPQTHCIFEVYDRDWKPVRENSESAPHAGEIEPGHQFEWAWLLANWARAGGRPDLLARASQLFQVATKGINPQTGAAVNYMNTRLERTNGKSRLWPQTEWLKAALILRELGEETEQTYYEGHIARAAQSVMRYLDTPVRGLWHDVLMPDTGREQGSFESGDSPASSFYHIVSMFDQMKSTSETLANL